MTPYKHTVIFLLPSLVQQFSGVSVIRAYVVKIFDKVFKEYDLAEGNMANITSVIVVRLYETEPTPAAKE